MAVPARQLSVKLTKLDSHGFPTWTVTQVAADNMEIGSFVEDLGKFCKLHHQTRTEAIEEYLGTEGSWDAFESCTVEQMSSFLQWIQEIEVGKYYAKRLGRLRKLETKMVGGLTVLETAWICYLKEQKKHLVALRKLATTYGPELETHAMNYRNAYQGILRTSHAYVGPNRADIGKRCRASAAAAGEGEVEEGPDVVAYALKRSIKDHGNLSKSMHIDGYLQEPTRRDNLREWLMLAILALLHDGANLIGHSKTNLRDLCMIVESIEEKIPDHILHIINSTKNIY